MTYQITDVSLGATVLFSALGGALVAWLVMVCWYEIRYRKYLYLARSRLRGGL